MLPTYSDGGAFTVPSWSHRNGTWAGLDFNARGKPVAQLPPERIPGTKIYLKTVNTARSSAGRYVLDRMGEAERI